MPTEELNLLNKVLHNRNLRKNMSQLQWMTISNLKVEEFNDFRFILTTFPLKTYCKNTK
jgi:hypothetical protein